MQGWIVTIVGGWLSELTVGCVGKCIESLRADIINLKFYFTEKCQAVYFNYDAVIVYLMLGWPGLEELQNQTIFSTLQKGHENNVTFWRMTQMVQWDTVKRVTHWVTWASSWTYPFTSLGLVSLPVKCFTREAVKILILISTLWGTYWKGDQPPLWRGNRDSGRLRTLPKVTQPTVFHSKL